jgi:hypothetical protein
MNVVLVEVVYEKVAVYAILHPERDRPLHVCSDEH